MVYRTAIVGTGGIAVAHIEGIRALGGRAEVSAVVDIDTARARAFAETWGIARVHASVDEMLAAEKPDLVHICTPPGSHLPLTAAVLRGGSVPLVEKPPAMTLAEIDEAIAVERETGRQAVAVFQQRFGSGAVRLRQAVADGTFGRPLVAVCNTLWYRDAEYFAVPWRGNWEIEGGGPTMGHGIHQFDLLLSILGPWQTVRAVAARQDRPTDTEDVSAAIVTFENGAIATVLNSLVSPRETSSLRFDFEHATVELEHLYGYGDADWRFTPAPGSEALAESWSGAGARAAASEVRSGHAAQFSAIFDALDAGRPAPVGLDDARQTMDLVASIYASAFEDRTVIRGSIDAGDPFYASMLGTGAPWLTALTGATA
ncbi:Gfo/Idh/MocA family protein [Leifsonia sp. Leaf264]|uniref:Gfo/Idh/MocA family protein n=1 Tax=Leifsonia sp. Leaf264 TaxID=1736314 RepID=UPI0006F5B89E|nr:Gfo/Idh/MocA family oxidoreductase [Leifsonia sp. Leaf264]KQO97043.1 oxidoreductase [Leifsonia sp. Leaf264]